MICIYSQNNINYEANGDAVLEPISCDLEITINGAWSLTLEHPYDPEGKYKYIVEGAVIRADIRCIRELTGIRQRFRIYDYKKGLHSVTAIAFPIAMESTYDAPIDNLVIQNKTGIQAMADLQAKTNKYTLATDITKIASSSFSNTNVNSAIASGSDNCFIKAWGGEILYDNLTFNVKSRIGDTEAGDHQVTYGHNLTDITYTKDDSGLITRIYPISQDGIRLNGTGYVDSPKISDYPVIHSHFIQAPYTLINTDAASPSQTAQQTRTSGAAVNTSANTLALSSYSTALAAGYEPEYIKGIRQEIIQAVQTMALASVISTSLYNYLSGIISNAMNFMSELEQPAWDWMGSWEDGWKYGNENGYAVSRYVKIGKTWSYLNAEGYWEEPRDDSGSWDWYQAQADPGRRYGNFTHYYAHNENVYITMSGTLTKYYFDSDGWYDDSKTEASTWDWHGSGTAEDPYWFGESGATSEESNKYAHDCWLFIDGSLYFFDHFGYYTPGNKFADYQWDWVETSDGFWFGNAIDQTYGAVYLKSQWAKINGDWIYFDENGYAVQENASQSAAVEVFTTGMAGLKTVVDAQTTILYDLLYSLMTQYANSRYAAGVDVPAVTITVDMADLSKTTEYAGFENLETVKLGDAVICTDNEHNISMTSRVIGLTYDCIRDYNSTVVIGKAGASIFSIVGNANSEVVSGGFDTTALEAQITALQNKVGDIFMNDASIVSNGVGRFAIQPGSNISISRSGNTLIINSTGGDGDVNLYHGIDTPDNSLGDEKDIYLQMESAVGNLLSFDASNSGTSITNYSATETNRKWDITATFVDNWEYHSFAVYSLQNLTVGKKYAISFDFQNDGVPPLYGIGELFGLTLQHSNRFIDMRNWSSDLVENGEFKYFADSYYGEWWYQSFPNDTERVHYEFEFTARQTTEYIGFYGDRTSGNLTCSLYELCVGDREETNEIKDVFYKINGEWLLYEGGETYEAGDNITIADGVISATDTDEIAELDDVSLTNLADGEILKYNATTQKWENAEDSGGSEVEANPSGTATDTLTKLSIDGTIYEIQGGGGGTGGSSVYSEKQLYKASVDSFQNISVTWDWDEYDAYIFSAHDTCLTTSYKQNGDSTILTKAQIKNLIDTELKQYIYRGNGYTVYVFSDSTITANANSEGFFITEIIGLKFGTLSPIIYSTEEREVGVGENNKPLYQKTVVSQTLSAETRETVLTGIDSLKVISIRSNKNYPSYISTYNIAGGGTEYGMVSFENGEVTLYNAGRQASIVIEAVLQYTKTTDVAGSAQYTTLGVPAHHYDGEEKIIGTWFGETLYERTFNGLATNTNGDSWVNIGGIDASTWKDAVNVEIYCNSSDVNNKLTRIALGEARVFNGNVQVTTSVSYNRQINVATIQYTKTT